MMKRWRFFLYLSLSLALILSGFIAWQRISWENAYKKVGLMIPYSQIAALAKHEKISISKFLAELKDRGVTTVSVTNGEIAEWRETLYRLPPWINGGAAMPPSATISLQELKNLQTQGFNLALIVDGEVWSDRRTQLSDLLAAADLLAPRGVYFASGRVWGWPQDLAKFAGWLTQNHIQWGVVEFAEAQGAAHLFELGEQNFVRVHRIKDDELAELDLSQALDRWERAVIERNIRILDVRLRPSSIVDNLNYLEDLRGRIRTAGFAWEWPSSPGAFKLALWIPIALGVGFCSLITLIGLSIFPLSVLQSVLLWGIGTVVLSFGLRFQSHLFAQILALGIALCAPLAAFLLTDRLNRVGNKQSWMFAFLCVLLASLTSAFLGIMMAASLSQDSFFLKLEEFQGVKISLVAPLIFVFFASFKRDGWAGFRYFWSQPLRIQDLALLATGVIILGVIILRSGNFSLLPVPESEQNVRDLLENWLYARPRFKEFFLGHPLLFAWAFWGRERLGFYAPIVLIGAWIGQVSIVNTFAHLHTPLLLSVLRTINGLIAGLMVAGLSWLLILGGRWVWQRISTIKS
ncbi:hypothetical protein HYR54_11975 [Candidatus Acetothermia bacterium]|nr:hypothetical protein [Candidatus Acetothermia bacterium]